MLNSLAYIKEITSGKLTLLYVNWLIIYRSAMQNTPIQDSRVCVCVCEKVWYGGMCVYSI